MDFWEQGERHRPLEPLVYNIKKVFVVVRRGHRQTFQPSAYILLWVTKELIQSRIYFFLNSRL